MRADMIELLPLLLIYLFVLLIPVALIVMVIIALVRTAKIGEMSARMDRLESAFRQRLRVREAEAQPAPPSHVLPLERERAPRPERRPPVAAEHVETWIGKRALGWVAVGLLLFAVAFFLKYAFENDWIGEQVRVAIGIVVGIAMCLAGFGFHRHGWRRFSQMVSGGGVAVLYLTTYAAFGYYHLLVREWAAVFLTLIVVQSAAMALLYDAPAIAIMGIIGGLLNPILLATEVDQYPAFFTYLALLNAGAVGLTVLRTWPALATIAFVGTQGLFWVWHAQHYEPDKLSAAVLFQSVLFALYLTHTAIANWLRGWRATVEDLVRLLLNAYVFLFTLWWLLDPDYHLWMGAMALGLALLYTALTWLLVSRRPEDRRLAFTVIAAAVGLGAAVFPLQTEAGWITLGWAVEGAALWWFGLRGQFAPLRYFGAALLGLAACRLVLVDTPFAHAEPFVPVFNRYGLPAVAAAACVLSAAIAARYFLAQLQPFDRVVRWATGLGGVLLLWIVLSTETYEYFTVRISLAPEATQADEADHLQRVAQTSLSIVWTVYAALVLAVGFAVRNVPLRALALGLFGLTLAKVVAIDMENLPGLYRVAAFLALALVMGVAAWWYQKHKPLAQTPPAGKETSHAA